MINLNYQRPLDNITFGFSSENDLIIFLLPEVNVHKTPKTLEKSSFQEGFLNCSSTENNYFPSNSKWSTELLERLDVISSLTSGWNGYQAQEFSSSIIDKAKLILSNVSILSEYISVFPTANSSIQIEYENSSSVYCEMEVFEGSVSIYCEVNGSETLNKSFSSSKEAANTFISLF